MSVADLANLIAELASADDDARARAAAELYRLGCALGDVATRRWRADSQFAALLSGRRTVGIAVQPERFLTIREAVGAARLAEVPPDQDAQEFQLDIQSSGGEAWLDILTTRARQGGGAIARFLEKSGEGIQQVEYEVTDVDRATEILRARFGQQPIYPQTRPGADGARVNFFLVATPEGKKVLIELVEPRRGPA